MRTGWLVLPLLLAGCSTGAPEELEGVFLADDGVFRYLDFPGQDVDETYEVLHTVVRLFFSGGVVVEDRDNHAIETRPRAYAGRLSTVTFYSRVEPSPAGSRVEVFARVDEMKKNVKRNIDDPWRFGGRDQVLEDHILRQVWDELMVRRADLGDEEAPES